ncbi:MAG TPA: antitoxin Xre/MbcA/ParS toxin-binding domain-containing protein [Hanamia sp.]|jgi:putative toxin-antitoxin system antitoxin component (TIGR02293 family)|nr:antitoxin Xre/MbcA/ParS toxin-binding domain-containing protein [Hanamia sp.]
MDFTNTKCLSLEKENKMNHQSKKIKPYSIEEDTPSMVEEAAIAYGTRPYETLTVILGGNKNLNKSLSGDFDLIDLSRSGIKKSTLKSLAGYLGINMETMSELLHSSYRNIQRKDEDQLLDTLKTEKVLELAAFAQRGIQVIGDKESFAEWLHSPLVSLGNKTPLNFLDTSFGIQMVSKLLGRLEQGVY